jgi:quercetin dioxygenase-like cupin family protein
MPIEQWDTRCDGALNEAGMRRKLESRGYRCATYVYPPGTHFPDHAHDEGKIDAVLSGQFRITLEGIAHDLHAGDCLHIPRGKIHNAAVIGSMPVVSIDAIATST